uniref:Uncharacterized protein n=1 Tax=Oryza punctata TaxID=4537 RepID=A0A0E0KML2_ORYPU
MYHVTVLFAFSPLNPTTRALLDALSATLPYFPLLTARLERCCRHRHGQRWRRCSRREGRGVVSDLADHLPLRCRISRASTHRSIRARLRNICSCWYRSIASRAAALSMHRAPCRPPTGVIAARRRHELDRTRRRWCHPASTLLKSIANLLVHITQASSSPSSSSAQGKYTTFGTVSAHVWNKITALCGLNAGALTSVNVSVNGRARLGTATVTMGNLIINASSSATVRELTTSSLADAAMVWRWSAECSMLPTRSKGAGRGLMRRVEVPSGLVRLIPIREGLEGIYSTPIVVWNYSPSIPSNPHQSPPNQTRPQGGVILRLVSMTPSPESMLRRRSAARRGC